MITGPLPSRAIYAGAVVHRFKTQTPSLRERVAIYGDFYYLTDILNSAHAA